MYIQAELEHQMDDTGTQVILVHPILVKNGIGGWWACWGAKEQNLSIL
jgi:hypothetical protein